jgi:hypothetical protein
MEMSAFRDLTQEVIDRGDMKAAAAHFDIAAWALREGNAKVRSAHCVSYLEDLDLRGKHGRQALELMRPELRTAWRQAHEYLEGLLDESDPKGQLAILSERIPRRGRKG